MEDNEIFSNHESPPLLNVLHIIFIQMFLDINIVQTRVKTDLANSTNNQITKDNTSVISYMLIIT